MPTTTDEAGVEEGVVARGCSPWHRYLQGKLFVQRWPGEKASGAGLVCYAMLLFVGGGLNGMACCWLLLAIGRGVCCLFHACIFPDTKTHTHMAGTSAKHHQQHLTHTKHYLTQ